MTPATCGTVAWLAPTHPGRALRKGEECTRATALTVRAALQHVVEDLGAWAAEP